MNKIMNMVHLDLISLKPNFKIGMVIFLLVLMIPAYLDMGSLGIALVVLMFSEMVGASDVFSAGRGGLDSLYASLFVERKTVVIARYLFSTLTSFVATVIAILIGLAVSLMSSNYFNMSEFLILCSANLLVMFVMSSINLPILFKLGFKNARTISMILPMALPFVAFMLVNVQDMEPEYLMAQVSENLQQEIILAILICVVVKVVSCLLSIKFYTEREF